MAAATIKTCWQFTEEPGCDMVKRCPRKAVYLIASEDDFGGTYLGVCEYHLKRYASVDRVVAKCHIETKIHLD